MITLGVTQIQMIDVVHSDRYGESSQQMLLATYALSTSRRGFGGATIVNAAQRLRVNGQWSMPCTPLLERMRWVLKRIMLAGVR